MADRKAPLQKEPRQLHKAIRPQPVWDLPLRLFHWLLVILLGLAWFTGSTGRMDGHLKIGVLILALILFRILWGFVGGRHARFRSFLASPVRLIAYLKTLPDRKSPPYAGHNPLGGIAVAVMLGAILVQTLTGLFASDDIITDGPLVRYVSRATSEWLTGIHHANVDILIALAALHLLAIAFYQLYKSQKLVRAMITGKKDLPAEGEKSDSPPVESPREGSLQSQGSLVRATLVLVICLLAVSWLF